MKLTGFGISFLKENPDMANEIDSRLREIFLAKKVEGENTEEAVTE